MNKIFIIEHLENELYDWCIIEYKHISKIVGKESLWFTNIKKSDIKKLSKYGKVIVDSIKSLNLDHVCVLDPEAHILLTPERSKSFEYFVFGGILGDYPPKKRTKSELTDFVRNGESFNIGKEQMSTDNAVYTVKQIISGKSFNDLKFQDNVDIKINKVLTTQLPYRYNLVNKKPLISPTLIKFIKNKDKK